MVELERPCECLTLCNCDSIGGMNLASWSLTKKSLLLSLIGYLLAIALVIYWSSEEWGYLTHLFMLLVSWITPCAIAFYLAIKAVRQQERFATTAFAITAVLLLVPTAIAAYNVYLDALVP